MRTINTTFNTFGASVLLLGLKGDSNATEILIDCAESLEEYQGTMAAMSITGPDETVYPGDISLDENGIVHWVVAARDCGIAGHGSARVDLVDDLGTVVASAEARTIIMKTNMQGIAPDQIANWTEAASVALQEARAALLDLIDTDDTATTNEAARQLAETGRVSAETLRASAETARASAETARATAETARASAETARANAETDRAIAETARIAAETARVSEFSTIEANAQAALSYIGPSEDSSTASAAHAAGSYFIYNGKLYQATADIAIGDTITSGTNCAQVPGGSMGEVSNLKSAISDTNDTFSDFLQSEIGKTTYVFTYEDGKAWYTSESPVTLKTPNNTVWKFCKIPCTSGDTFHVNINAGGSNYRPWAFVNESMELLSKASVNIVDTDITAPENAAYLLCNVRDDPIDTTGVHKVTKGTSRIAALEDRTSAAESDIMSAFTEFSGSAHYRWLSGVVATNTDIIDPNNVVENGWYHIVADCENVKYFLLSNKTTNSTYRPYAFIDENGTRLQVPTTSLITDGLLLVPGGATKLICNTSSIDGAFLIGNSWGSILDKIRMMQNDTLVALFGTGLYSVIDGNIESNTYIGRSYQAKSEIITYPYNIVIRCQTGYQFKVKTFDSSNNTWVAVENDKWFRNADSYIIKGGTAFALDISVYPVITDYVVNIDTIADAFVITRVDTIKGFDHSYFAVQKPKLVAHRGYNGDDTIPENSIPSIKKAANIGAWAIEFDVRETSDGYFVLMHDSTVDRTTNGTGTVANMTYAQIEELNLIGGDGTLKVPTLEQAISIIRTYGIVAFVDVKGIKDTETSMAALINAINNAGYLTQTVFLVYEHDVANWLDFYSPKSLKLFGFSDLSHIATDIDTVEQYSNIGMMYPANINYAKTASEICHNANMPLFLYSSSAWDAQKEYFSVGVDMIASNRNLIADN